MNTNIRTFSSKKLVLGLVTTAIGISTIALVSENAHASTSTVKSQTVTKKTKTTTLTTKPTTTVKTVKPAVVKATTTKAATNVTTKKPRATVKPIAQKAPVTKQSVPVKKPVSKAISTTTIKAPVTSKVPTTTAKKASTTTKVPTTTAKKPSITTKVPTTTAKKASTTTKVPATTAKKPSTTTKVPKTTAKKPSTPIKSTTISSTKTQTTPVKTQGTPTKTQASSKTTPQTTKSNTPSTVPTPSAPVQPSTIANAPVKTNEESQNTVTPKLENTNIQDKTLQSQETIKATPETETKTASATRKQDYYKSMTELYKDTTEGIDWKKDTRNVGKSVLIVAPHGGNIEQGTSELTKLVANNGDFDYFSFEAIRPSNNTQLHVTSTNYDDATLHEMIQDRTATISIHGAQGEEQLVYLGGYQSPLRDAIQSQLELKGFVVKIPPEYLGGLSNANFINKVEESTGVQLELTTALRKAFFKDEDTSTASRKKIENWTTTMYDFAEALNGAIKQVYPENQG
ncbi:MULTISPECIES: poly-gamma-glutamate hydrolase family protein [Staphylococcus]|nr:MULTISPECIES: poly-gamma-glutamate hydrolase family protein [Staphylococcus]MDU9350290.1 poly-gamma-glutamate hydrolase family protein [Staphylococcus ureilyticus]SCS92741.1 Phage-related replication protein [Staphylococcus cohnii subsp. cohnii]